MTDDILNKTTVVMHDIDRLREQFNRKLCMEFKCEADELIDTGVDRAEFPEHYAKCVSAFSEKLRNEGACKVLMLEARQVIDREAMSFGSQLKLVALCIKQKPE